jgi:hypothetical protein
MFSGYRVVSTFQKKTYADICSILFVFSPFGRCKALCSDHFLHSHAPLLRSPTNIGGPSTGLTGRTPRPEHLPHGSISAKIIPVGAATLQTIWFSGQFHGVIRAQTPIASAVHCKAC